MSCHCGEPAAWIETPGDTGSWQTEEQMNVFHLPAFIQGGRRYVGIYLDRSALILYIWCIARSPEDFFLNQKILKSENNIPQWFFWRGFRTQGSVNPVTLK